VLSRLCETEKITERGPKKLHHVVTNNSRAPKKIITEKKKNNKKLQQEEEGPLWDKKAYIAALQNGHTAHPP